MTRTPSRIATPAPPQVVLLTFKHTARVLAVCADKAAAKQEAQRLQGLVTILRPGDFGYETHNVKQATTEAVPS